MKDITTLKTRFDDLIQELTVYLLEGEENEKQRLLQVEEDRKLAEKAKKLDEDQKKLDDEKLRFSTEKEFVEKQNKELADKAEKLRTDRVWLDKQLDEMKIKREKLNRELEELEEKQVYIQRQVEVDRKRKEVLDATAAKLRLRIKQLMVEGEIEVP